MDSVTDICTYHFLCFVTIIQVKVISGHQLKRSNRKISGFRAAIHVFRSDFRNQKITAKSRNDVKSAYFDMFYVISQPFLKISTGKFVGTHIHWSLPSNMLYVFFGKL